MLATLNICERQHVLRSEIARFNARAAAGEFANHRCNRGSTFYSQASRCVPIVFKKLPDSDALRGGSVATDGNDSLLFGVRTRRVFSATAQGDACLLVTKWPICKELGDCGGSARCWFHMVSLARLNPICPSDKPSNWLVVLGLGQTVRRREHAHHETAVYSGPVARYS